MNIKFGFDVLLCYMYVGIVCAFVIGIVRNRARSTAYKETVDRNFVLLSLFFIVFCLLDAFWGIAGSTIFKLPRVLFVILTYIFHYMAATSSIATSIYAGHYFKVTGKFQKIFRIYRIVLFAGQLAFVTQNVFTNSFFIIDSDGVYHSNTLRYLSFYLQIFQYLPMIVYAIFGLIRNKKHENSREAKFQYRSGFIFLMIVILFCLLQMFYPDGPFYSLGFMVTSVAIYAFRLTSSRESYVGMYHTSRAEIKSKEQIELALEKAEAANKSKTIFLSNMSHDIRTPINGIMGMTTIAMKEEMNDNVRNCLKQIDDASHHLLSLINDVLDMSKIESGKIVINNQPINLISVSNTCLSIIDAELNDRNINFVRDLSKITHKYVLADELYLKQIFINILGNSVKFTPDGGTISFIAEEREEHGHFYRFIMSDTGIGMKKEFINKIFDPFAQEDGGSRTKYKGTGLGMSIVKQLVDLMDGVIEIESEYQKGTKITIDIPFEVLNVDLKAEEEEEEEDNFAKSLSGINVLLVEDNELNKEIAINLLESEGIKVTCANDGLEAVKAFKESQVEFFDCILMDIMMPNLNGADATKEIRKLERKDAKTVPIIAMTANAFEEDKKAYLEAGMNSCVTKPIDFSVLFREIKKLI